METSILERGPILLCKTIYPDESVRMAVNNYTEFVSLEKLNEDGNIRTYRLIVNPKYSSKSSQLRKEFLNYLLDLAIQHHLGKQ